MDTRQLSHRWFEEVWNRGNDATIDELAATDALIHGLGEDGRQLTGAEGFRHFYRLFREAFPDLHVTVEDVIAEGDKTAVRFSFRATHSGHGLGVAPTGRPVSVTGMVMMRWADGKIAEAWNEFDAAALLRQITQTAPQAKVRATV